MLMNDGNVVNQENIFGHVPGIAIGDKFKFKYVHHVSCALTDFIVERSSRLSGCTGSSWVGSTTLALERSSPQVRQLE